MGEAPLSFLSRLQFACLFPGKRDRQNLIRKLAIQGYLAHMKQRPPRTLQLDYAQGTMVVLGGVAVS